MRLQRFMLGTATGLGIGYLAWRAFESARAMREIVPREAASAERYGRMRRGLALSALLRSAAGSLALAYGPGGSRISRITAQVPIALRPAAFALVVGLLDTAADLPVAFIEDHRLEGRYGLTEQSTRDWAVDYAKSAVIGNGLTAVLATLMGAGVRRLPKTWPIFAAIGTLPLLVLANVIVPIYVMPLFNRFEPLTGPLESRLRTMAKRYGVGDADILRMDMSRQTKKANAFVAGIWNTHRIVLGDTLIDSFTLDEIEFVVAHELGHYVARDTWRMVAIAQALATTLFFAANFAIPKSEREQLREDPLLLARIATIMTLGSLLLRPVLLAFSRSREWAADRFAVATTSEPGTGAAAFHRLRDQNLAEDDVPGWYEIFFSSHPSLGQRISALQATRRGPFFA